MMNRDLINRRVEFNDENLEELYYAQQIGSSKPYFRHIILIVGTIYFLSSVMDYIQLDTRKFLLVLLARALVFAFSVISWFVIGKTQVVKVACACITFFPPILFASTIFVAAIKHDQAYFFQVMTVMVIIFCTTLMPNRWVNLVFINLMMAAILLVTLPTYVVGIPLRDYALITFYLLLTLAFAIIAQHRSNLNQREKFLREKQLETQSVTDALTGLNNRLWFDINIADWCSNTKKEQRFSLVLIDIDDFKKVNDTYGHLVGDSVLVQCTELFRSGIHSSDVLVRWGGEEFAVLLQGAGLEKAAELAERMRKSIEDHNFDVVGRLTCSFGVAVHQPGQTSDALMNEADTLLYKAKESGKNRVEYKQ